MKKISVIIVNYNVKDFLEQALLSVRKALQEIPSEIIVVDNASIDGSVQMLKERFPDIHLIESQTNLGFSGGNNLGLERAEGKFIVLLNPDTVVQEDTFTKLLDFFEKNPEASAATCKILNPDGTFSVDCRHSVPTPLTAFWKLLGLNRLFPKSKLFGKYNLTYLDENELNQVEAISGSFMMIRSETVQKVGKLDEDYFMYCEDIDYCHRINQSGGKIFYVPDSQIIHYKGESTKKDNLDYVITFNRSLYTFYKKHYQQKYISPFKWLILLGVIFRGFIIYTQNIFKTYFPFLIDVVLLNFVLYAGFFFRQGGRAPDAIVFFKAYFVVNLITTILFFFSALFFNTVIKDRFSIAKVIKANFITFTLMAASTFFLKQIAYSRLVVLVSMFFSIALMLSWRMLLRSYSRKATHTQGKQFFLKRTLIVGLDEEARYLLSKLREWPDSGLNILGLVSIKREDLGKKIEDMPVVTALEMLTEYLRMNKVDLVIFTTNNVSYEEILSTMAAVKNPRIEFKMVPGHLEFMVSKSNVERFDSIPLLNIEYAYGKPFNRFVKRLLDVTVSAFLIVLFSPFLLIALLFNFKKIEQRTIQLGTKYEKKILWFSTRGILRYVLNLVDVFRGRLSLVGAPLDMDQQEAFSFDYKPGLTGIRKISSSSAKPQTLELQYLKNQDLLLDLEIIFRSLFMSQGHKGNLR